MCLIYYVLHGKYRKKYELGFDGTQYLNWPNRKLKMYEMDTNGTNL